MADNDNVTSFEHASHVNVRQHVWLALRDINEVIDVTCSPTEVVRRGEQANVSIVMRVDMLRPPESVMRATEQRVIELRQSLPEIGEAQMCPELNFPPTSAKLDNPLDAWLEVKAEVMRIVEPFRLVIAVYFAEGAPDGGTSGCTVYVYGENDAQLTAALNNLGLAVRLVASPYSVPRAAKCLFNSVTRLAKAQAEGNAAEVERLKAVITGGAARLPVAPAGMVPTRGNPAEHFVRCRWCRFTIPASDNPAYAERCPNCTALQAATSIPTKSKEMPVISLFLNPNGSAYVEFVFAPPEPGRYDLSAVRRYTVPASCAQEFARHPMGKRNTEE